jgi:hypothetical protein
MSDLTVLRIDLEGLRQRLATQESRCVNLSDVHAWLRERRYVATAAPEIYVQGHASEPVLRCEEVLSEKRYA